VNRNGLQSRGGALLTSLYFSGGVLVSLLVIGVATSLMGQMIGDIGQTGMVVVGAVFVLTGLWLVGVNQLQTFLNWDSQARGTPWPLLFRVK
jgi:cytochrome c biogenesis protein CcdA